MEQEQISAVEESEKIIESTAEETDRSGERSGEGAKAQDADGSREQSDGLSYSEKQREKFEKSKALKRGLIEEAKGLVDSTQWNLTFEKQKELMERWKKSGYAAEENESLWEEFQEARKGFFDNRKKHFAQMDEMRVKAAEAKKALIEEVRGMNFSEETYEADSKKMDDIFTRWKNAGFAERKENDRLWDEFNEARAGFSAIRDSFRKKQDEEFEEKRAKKRSLIEATKEILKTGDIGKDNTEKIKALNLQWKEVGFSGKKGSQELWDEFKSAQDEFWNVKRERAAKRSEEGITKLQEAINRRRHKIDSIKENTKSLSSKVMQPGNGEMTKRYLEWMSNDQEKIEVLKKEIEELEEKIEKLRVTEGKRS